MSKRILDDIRPGEVDDFINHFALRGLFNSKKMNAFKQNSSVNEVVYHSDKWYDISIDSLDLAEIKLSDNGFLYRIFENSSLILFKTKKYFRRIQLIPIGFSMRTDSRADKKYQNYLVGKGFYKIEKSFDFDKNMLLTINYNLI